MNLKSCDYDALKWVYNNTDGDKEKNQRNRMKSYTNLEQSKKLSEILPLESADMCYSKHPLENYYSPIPHIGNYSAMHDQIPCWSIAALLNILAEQDFIIKSSERNNKYQYNIDIPSRHCKIWFPSLLDAAFEMIYWLKENGKI